MRFVPFPGLSSSGNQVLCEHTVPGDLYVLISSLVSATQFPGWATRAPSQVCHVSPLGSWSLAVTLLEDVNQAGSQEDLVSNWEPAPNLVEDAISGAEIAPWLPAVTRLPLCLWWGDGLVHSRLALLWYSLNLLFCEQARLCLRIEIFVGKFSLSLFFPPLSGYHTVWVAISL